MWVNSKHLHLELNLFFVSQFNADEPGYQIENNIFGSEKYGLNVYNLTRS